MRTVLAWTQGPVCLLNRSPSCCPPPAAMSGRSFRLSTCRPEATVRPDTVGDLTDECSGSCIRWVSPADKQSRGPLKAQRGHGAIDCCDGTVTVYVGVVSSRTAIFCTR